MPQFHGLSMIARLSLLILAVLFLVPPSQTLGDVIHFIHGGQMTVQAWRDTGDEIEATTAGGLMRFQKADIARIEGAAAPGELSPSAVPAPSESSSPSGVLSVRYVVTGDTNTANVTYRNAQGEREQVRVGVPWTISFEARKGAPLYLSARNAKAYGSISCEIFVNGTSVRHVSSEGGYKTASCSRRT